MTLTATRDRQVLPLQGRGARRDFRLSDTTLPLPASLPHHQEPAR